MHAKFGTGQWFIEKNFPTDPPFGSPDDWKVELVDGLNTLFYRDRNYVPDDLALQQDVVWMLHDHEMAGHPGEAETLVAVEQHYWWPGLCTFVWVIVLLQESKTTFDQTMDA